MPSRMPLCMVTHKCARRSLICLNIFYMLSATILILVASCGRYQTFLTSQYLFGAMIGIGAFLIALSGAGLWGTIRHSQVILFFYIIILFVVFAVQFGVACSCLAMLSSGAQTQRAALLEAIWTHIGVSAQSDVQSSLQCCGFYDAKIVDGPFGHPSCTDVQECAASTTPCCLGVPTGMTSGPEGHHSSAAHERGERIARINSTLAASASEHGKVALAESDKVSVASVQLMNASCPVQTVCEPLIGAHVNAALQLVGVLGVLFALFQFVGLFLTYRYRNMRDPRLYERATKAWGTDLLRTSSDLHATLEIN